MEPASTMKVRVSVTLDIDPEEWMSEYGCDRKEVRADVQQWAQDALRQHLATVQGR